ncbi:hypothetical protein, partial [Microbulbifer sp.]|uniref:hypothetical protein n=1 Tax=Microbulbifer sp. TaxID=1908541 RepID=UPI002F920F1E
PVCTYLWHIRLNLLKFPDAGETGNLWSLSLLLARIRGRLLFGLNRSVKINSVYLTTGARKRITTDY